MRKEILINILKKNNLFAKKSFGQNFLINDGVLDTITEFANIKDKFVLEIGPGLGFLTERLKKGAKLVLALEKDRNLVEYLRKRYKSDKNIKIKAVDALFYNEDEIKEPYDIVANLPYNITSPFIRKFLFSKNKPEKMVLMIQKEVAERIMAKPGSRERGFLTLLVEMNADINYLLNVGRESFFPVPAVDSAVIEIKLNQKVPLDLQEGLINLFKIGFSQKRRQIHHPLTAGFRMGKDEIISILDKSNIDSKLRAEDLSLDEWIRLYKNIKN